MGTNKRYTNEELVITELGQVGTQFDMFSHQSIDGLHYNCIKTGDAVLINTGWGKLWGKDNAKYNAGCPGIGVAAAEWLAKQDVMLLGSDNFPVEIAPNPDRNLSLPVHQIALAVNGIFLLENMKLDELAAQKVYEFAFIVQPLKIKGGTGSTVAPVAVR